MALSDIAQEKLDRLESVPANFTNAVSDAQMQELNAIIKLLDQLELDGGIIKATDRNFALVGEISNNLGNIVFSTDYQQSIIEFAKEFDNQAVLNQAYFTEQLGRKLNDKALYQSMLNASKTNAVDLLNSQAIQLNLSTNLKNVLLSSVSNEISYSELVQAVNVEIVGDAQREGALLRYSKQIARDFFNIGDSSYTNIVAEDLSMDWYQYSAGKVKDSRDFCLVREGNYYHKSEIELWPYPAGSFEANPVPRGHQWQGRHPDTNSGSIWFYRGGYNCMHSFLPVLQSQVPQEVIDRVNVQENKVLLVGQTVE